VGVGVSRNHDQYGQHRYGTLHKKLRRRWAPKVRVGKVSCWRCGKPIPVGGLWDLGHVEGAAAVAEFGVRHPEHRRCNRSTLPRMLAEARGERGDGLPARQSRDW
jgi:hypothetical protein